MKVGIMGYGFVGKAIHHLFDDDLPINIYDPPKGFTYLGCLDKCDYVFICVPTPTKEGKGQDSSIVEESFKKLLEISFSGTAIVKSTILPSKMKKLEMDYGDHFDIVANPEFLNQASAVRDVKNPRSIIVGSRNAGAARSVINLYFSLGFGTYNTKIFKTSEEAMFVKYMINTFFCVKNSFFNECHLIADEYMDWDSMIEAVLMDGRITPVHTMVPGPDGKYGYGGACLVKDSEAFISEYDIDMVEQSVFVNRRIRNEE